MELSSSNIKKFLYFLKRKLLYFRKWNPALFSPSSKNNKNPPRENFLCFRKRKPLKTSYFFSKETPQKFFIFQETEPSYISGKVYSEPWHI